MYTKSRRGEGRCGEKWPMTDGKWPKRLDEMCRDLEFRGREEER